MGVPKYHEMYQPLLQLLSDGAPHTLKEMKQHIIRQFQLSEDDVAEMLPSGRQTYFSNRVGWARTYLKKAGLVEIPAKSTCRITQAGLAVLQKNPPVIDNAYLMQFDSFRAFVRPAAVPGNALNQTVSDAEDPGDTPDDTFETSFKKINQSLADDLLAEVMKLTPVAFEKLVLDLMAKMGYGTFANAAKTTAITGDEGIDGIIMQDKLGFDLIYVQAKHWSADHSVGRPDVQAFVGAIAGKGGKGLFVTTSRFTQEAIDYARKQHLILMDGQRMAMAMIEHDFGVSTQKVFAIKALDSDIFEQYQEE